MHIDNAGNGGRPVFSRRRELSRLPKAAIAQIHVANGGLMGLRVYMKWTKEELVNTVLRDEGDAE